MSWDSRSFGAACCSRCDEDLSDDLAGNGAVLCAPCLKIEQGRHAISPASSADPLNFSPDPSHLNRELMSRAPSWLRVADEGEYDLENELFKSQIQHIIDSNNLAILEILEGWSEVTCPACSCRVTFDREGEGVLASCDECLVGADLDYVL